MKLLIATDIHGDRDLLEALLRKDFDRLILLGDLTNRSREMELFELLPEETLFIPGNNETEGCHGRTVEIGGLRFACLGGSIPTPFNTPFEIPEEEYRKIADSLGKFDILLSHQPPRGVLDRVGGKHVGSGAVRELIERVRPSIAFVGHIHEFAGHAALLGNTTVLNPGPRGFFLEI